MNTITIALSVFVLTLALLNKLSILQQKDYMRQRIFAQPLLLQPRKFEYSLYIVICAELINLFLTNDSQRTLFESISLIGLVIPMIAHLFTIAKRQFRKPRFTFRILLNLLLILGLWLLLCYPFGNIEVLASLFTLISTWLIIASNEVVRQIAFIGHRIQLRRAAGLLDSCQNLQRIGITGSYGKSTTKYFLNTLLGSKYSIVSTPGSVNTDIGLAKSINSQLGNQTQSQLSKLKFAVLEMDTYVVGTLARITKYFPLDIALLTSINEQHLETFGGNIQNTLKGNYQIFQGYRKHGAKIAVFNYDNKYCRELAQKLMEQNKSTQIYTYGSNEADNLSVRYYQVTEVFSPTHNAIEFKLKFSADLGGAELKIKLPVLGKFNANNFAAAALIAKLAGLSDQEILTTSSQVQLRDRNLQVYRTAKNVEVIDDSFSANPAGVDENIQLLTARNKSLPCPSVFITPGLEDLSTVSMKIHTELINKATTAADLVIVTHEQHARDIDQQKLTADQKKRLKIVHNPKDIIAEIDRFVENQKNTGESSTSPSVRIFISGRVNSAVLSYIRG